MKARTLINRALRTIGALGVGETPSDADAAVGLEVLNGLISAWQADRLAITHITRNSYTASASVAAYTLGPTGDWVYDSVPEWIDHAGVILPASDPIYEQPVEVATPQRWAQQPIKTMSFTPLAYVYYERTLPNGTVRLWPVPNQTVTVILYLLAPLTAFATLDTDPDLPSGYEEALAYNLAVRLCPEFGKALDPTVAALADTSLGRIRTANVFPNELVTDRALWQRPYGVSDRAAFLRGY